MSEFFAVSTSVFSEAIFVEVEDDYQISIGITAEGADYAKLSSADADRLTDWLVSYGFGTQAAVAPDADRIKSIEARLAKLEALCNGE